MTKKEIQLSEEEKAKKLEEKKAKKLEEKKAKKLEEAKKLEVYLKAKETEKLEKETDINKIIYFKGKYKYIKKREYKLFGIVCCCCYEPLEKRRKFLNKYKCNNWLIDWEFTNKKSLIIVEPKYKMVIFGMKGTELNDGPVTLLYDLLTDLGIGLSIKLPKFISKYISKFQKKEQKYLEIKKKYPDHEIIVTGHSMSAKIAYDLSLKFDLEAYCFSMPHNIFSTFGYLINPFRYNKRYYHKKIYIISIKRDPIGYLGNFSLLYGVKYWVPLKTHLTNDPHSCKNFI
jgi:hypothetical protein